MGHGIKFAVTAAVLLSSAALPLMPASALGSSSITGVAFEDANRNGLPDPGEPARPGDVIYLFNSAGTCIAVQTTDAAGRYTFAGLSDGTYRVEYKASTWWGMRSEWAPTTTGTLRPSKIVSAPSALPLDFGWRRILRSTTVGAPISSFTGAEGLQVASYNDVVGARELYAALARGTLGREAASIAVLFDLGTSSTSTSTVGASDGRYDTYSASSYVSYLSWLDNGDNTLSHEYGHAWSLYYAYLAQQDPTLAGYLSARGLSGDARVGSSYPWNPREMIAEDYRQLLGSPSAAAAPQMNQDVAPAAEVVGLREYLATTFTAAGAAPGPTPTASATPSPTPLSPTPAPTASATPTAEPTPAPTPTASATPSSSPTAAPSAAPSPTLSPSPTSPKRGGGGGSCRKTC